VGPTITPDTDDEEELGDNDVQPNGNASQSGVQGQQPQREESTELNGQPQGAKGAAKSAVEVGIFLGFLVLVCSSVDRAGSQAGKYVVQKRGG